MDRSIVRTVAPNDRLKHQFAFKRN